MNLAPSLSVLNRNFQLGMTIYSETGNAHNDFVILRIHGDPGKPSYCPSLCSCLYKYMYGRISGGSLGSERLFKHVRLRTLNFIFKS